MVSGNQRQRGRGRVKWREAGDNTYDSYSIVIDMRLLVELVLELGVFLDWQDTAGMESCERLKKKLLANAMEVEVTVKEAEDQEKTNLQVRLTE